MLDSEKHQIIDDALLGGGIQLSTIDIDRQLRRDMQLIVDHKLTKTDWKRIMKMYDEKTIIRCFFNSSRGSYQEFLKSLVNSEMESIMIDEQQHPIFTDTDDAKTFHSENYQPSLQTNTMIVGTTEFGSVAKLINSGKIEQFTVEGLIAYCFENYEIVISVPNAVKIIKQVNKQLKSLADQQFTRGEDDITKAALKIVRRYCTENKLSYEQSNRLGEECRMMSSKIANKIGTDIGNTIIQKKESGRLSKISKMLSDVCNGLKLSNEEVAYYFLNSTSGKKIINTTGVK